MNDLDTLNALLDAAGLGREKNDFESGTLTWTNNKVETREEALASLREAVGAGATGWTLFVDRSAIVDAGWDETWDTDHPLEAELGLPDGSPLRLTYTGGAWILAKASRDPAGEGILEHTSHRRLGGGRVRHLVSWRAASGQPLGPHSCALTESTSS